MTVSLENFSLLSTIDSPADLRRLSVRDLNRLAGELRLFLCESLDLCGGHFAANLGTVELAIAIHYCFNTPEDPIIWDVGHQAYPHKILTGRRDQISTIRQQEGLSPFPARAESVYDSFGVGHSSTSIGAALGMAEGFRLQHQPHQSLAIIGDGALTAGMAFEALSHAGDVRANMLVILNDNDMSISPNVGGLSKYLARLLADKHLNQFRENSKRLLEKLPAMWSLAKKTEAHVKGMLVPGTLFEELGFKYIGPVDGHDLDGLVHTLNNLSQQTGPRFLHVVTQKGKGYAPAEADPVAYHAVKAGFYRPSSTAAASTAPALTAPTYSQVFGRWICDMATQAEDLVGITPAMREGSDLIEFSKRFPERYYDVAIAEQHSVTFAAGLCCVGLKPVVAIYSTFLQRAYDQLIHDVAIQNLPVLFAIDRAGLVGGDGPTHTGNFDLSYLRCIPNLVIMAPADENECRQMLYTGFCHSGPAAVRYPRGKGPNVPIEEKMTALPLGRAEIRRHGQKIALLAFGSLLRSALTVGEAIDATVVNMRFVKPLDVALIEQLCESHDWIVTLEENTICGGAGSGVSEAMTQRGLHNRRLHLGLPDHFPDYGEPEVLLKTYGLDPCGILTTLSHAIPQLNVQKENGVNRVSSS